MKIKHKRFDFINYNRRYHFSPGSHIMDFRRARIAFILLFFALSFNACKKVVEVSNPVNTITSSQIFGSDATAKAAVVGIYNNMIYASGGVGYANCGSTIYQGMSADELINYSGPPEPFLTNTLLADNGDVEQFWKQLYYHVYLANAAIEGLKSSTGLSDGVRNQLTGEVKFIRAFCYFYLVNLFGDVPLATTTAWASTSQMSRTPAADIYAQIITDLKDAQNLSSDNYTPFDNERIRANKWAATALLARVYLYQGKWAEAESQASAVINNTQLFGLNTLSKAFLKNNVEAILQLQVINQSPWATQEGYQLIPQTNTSSPTYYLTTQLLGNFESGDNRRTTWIDSTDDQGTYYYYPKKYTVRQGTANVAPAEYYMILRLAEQYLIRAESRARLNKFSEAQSDLNMIRTRAGLGNTTANDSPSLLTAIMKERQVEFFAEWGHRWFDLKRTDQADNVLGAIKQQWQPTAKLYPIPLSELEIDPNLEQNPGYQ